MKSKTVEISQFRIAKLLQEKGWGQSDLAQKIGVSAQTVQQWVSGKSTPKPANLDKLSEITGFPVHWFLMDKDADENMELIIYKENDGLTTRQRILLELFEQLPNSDANEIMKTLEEKKRHNDKLFEELASKRGLKNA
ncbi:helix-turn-helix domain-containing protein [Yersinia enterocolitica]|uniref:helix-turn-helix domain-containing protein n=1 Tax=Yersinia enterocolitica TaxID=630 RepID=UPI00155AFF22|nr:helix-turn-helix domain-containing protein [Yersinia enterocolitica]MBX9485806.1 helix-turn-helix domain-containing protein [Yersinia enterocolitica]NQS96733.1 helix-turn-helix domain-containing protein [Yersinia enterocolitica]NQT43410.1 helix-turn-helix domain-containing protein [Yersinia enterocolitica]NQT98790.1 helix-turn-helix domain-containing protein [Yersinia enterocolitica]HDL8115258.1 helix-turn-helix domain-containing protein [Yersinia enterocolitica]